MEAVIVVIVIAVLAYVGILSTAKNSVEVLNKGVNSFNTIADQALDKIEEDAEYKHNIAMGKLAEKWENSDKRMENRKTLRAIKKARLNGTDNTK